MRNQRDLMTLVSHSNILFLEQERGDWRQNSNKPDTARTNPLPPNLAEFQSCMPWDHVDKRGRALFIKGRKSAVWMTKIMPKKADERVNRRKNRCHWCGGVTNPGNRRLEVLGGKKHRMRGKWRKDNSLPSLELDEPSSLLAAFQKIQKDFGTQI